MSVNPFDEYIASMKVSTKCRAHITIPRMVRVIKQNKITLKNKLRNTQEKVLALERELEQVRSLLPLPVEYSVFQFICDSGTPKEPQFIYNKNNTELTIQQLQSEKNTTHIDGSLLYFTDYIISMGSSFQLYSSTLYVTMNDKQDQLERFIYSLNNLKKIFITPGSMTPLDIEYRMGDTSNGRAKIMVSERLITSLSKLIQNNKQCEIHFNVGISNFMIPNICSKIKLRDVSKIVIYYTFDQNMYSTYMSKNPHIKMTQSEYAQSQMKLFMDSIKKKYYNKIHIISPMI